MAFGSTISRRLEWIKLIAIWISLLAIFGLILVFILVPDHTLNYAEQVRALNISQQHLPRLMFAVGLLLAAGTGMTTWVLAVYSSFRLAGPLYRMSENLKAAIATSEVDHVPLRQGDLLQDDARLLQDVSAHIVHRYQSLNEIVTQAQAAADQQDDDAVLAAIHALNGPQGGDPHDPNNPV